MEVAIGVVVLVISAAGYFGAGLYALQSDPVDWIYVAVVYAGPIGLIGLGLLLRRISLALAGRGTDGGSGEEGGSGECPDGIG